jgi:hypothetical protein
MNLSNPDCARAVADGLRRVIGAHDWDGVNLAELYFESLQGTLEPIPLHADERRYPRGVPQTGGFDPVELFDAASPNHYSKTPRG